MYIGDVVRRCGGRFSPYQIRRACELGILEASRPTGGRWVITEEAVDAWLAKLMGKKHRHTPPSRN